MLHYRISLVSTLYLNTCISILSNFCSTSLVNSWSCDNNSKDVLLKLNKVSYCFVTAHEQWPQYTRASLPQSTCRKTINIPANFFQAVTWDFYPKLECQVFRRWHEYIWRFPKTSQNFWRLPPEMSNFKGFILTKFVYSSRNGNSPDKSQSQNMYH